MRLLLLVFFLFVSLNFVGVGVCAQEKPLPPPGPQIQQIGPHNTIVVEAVGVPGHYTGFDVRADGKLVAPVRFTSRELIFSPDAAVVTKGAVSTLTFNDLQTAPDCGVSLQQSRVVVTLMSQQFPTVAFDLHLASFSPRQWQNTIGIQPFHFLTIGLPEATVWHQRGWLHATPRADLFPLLLDVHANTPELSAFSYNREWSLTPPLSAHPLPVIGLWSPARRLYAGWNFQATRLEDNSERDIATGFCNRLIVPVDLRRRQPTEETQPPAAPLTADSAPRGRNGQPPPRRDPRTRPALSYDQQASRELDSRGVGKFVALVYPPGGKDYQQLVYPAANAHIASRATLMFHTDMGDTDDPNRFLWQEWWNTPTIRSRLPRVPAIISLNRLPPALNTKAPPSLPETGLLTTAEDKFYLSGSLLLSGRGWRAESSVDAANHSRDSARLAQLQSDAQTLLHYVKRFTVDKEPCAFWEQPLAGEWAAQWGGEPTTTLHNPQGWAAGRMLLDLYRFGREEKRNNFQSNYASEREANQSIQKSSQSPLLPTIDGVFNWSRHVVWMRGAFADSPASASAMDSALPIAFLLDYYFTFKDDLIDGEHRTRALQALELARTFAYRALTMWTGQGDKEDKQNTEFLWEAGAGRDSMGAVSACEIEGSLDALAQVAVHTGDPILMWALQGSLSRPLLPYTGVPSARLTASGRNYGREVTEGMAEQSHGVAGSRAPTAAGAFLSLIEPLGDTNTRVLCGEKAALAFNRDAPGISIHNYRCSKPGEFAFTLHIQGTAPLSAAQMSPISATITFPFADLSRQSVALRHGSITQQMLAEGANLTREPDACWSILVRGLRDGDTVVVGKPDLSATSALPTVPPLTEISATFSPIQTQPNHILRVQQSRGK